MKTREHPLRLIHSNYADLAVPARSSGQRITVCSIVLALALLAVVNWVKPDQAAGHGTVASEPTESPNPSTEFVYFPGQYVNQATEPSEHIQAF